VLIGFHERKSRYLADMRVCPVLPREVSEMLLPLRELVGSMEARDTLPQIELACGDASGGLGLGVIALVLRHLEPLSAADVSKLKVFALQHVGVQWWLQAKGPDTVKLLEPGGASLAYELPEFDLTMPFKPTDFTQVNPHINRALVAKAMRLLDVQAHERVIDWFCGLGNFTLPIACRARAVLGVEGSGALVARATENFQRNQIATVHRAALAATKFVSCDLFEMTPTMLMADGTAEKWLIDPPREGAFALIKSLSDLCQETKTQEGSWSPPKRIVYVSCNPSTLARDAGLLVHQAGYRCAFAGVVNMFPHTAHVESIAVFERT
jgi:23S rRNA (uracil1939-C5)-methyltransferase